MRINVLDISEKEAEMEGFYILHSSFLNNALKIGKCYTCHPKG